jgi:hypothetical protein
MAQAWVSTLFISLVPIFLIYLLSKIFLLNSRIKDSVSRVLIAFAIGGLLGDVFFHTFPHMNEGGHNHGHSHSHGHDHEHEYHHGELDKTGHAHSPEEMYKYGIVVLGIIAFFMLELITNMCMGGHSHNHGDKHDHA